MMKCSLTTNWNISPQLIDCFHMKSDLSPSPDPPVPIGSQSAEAIHTHIFLYEIRTQYRIDSTLSKHCQRMHLKWHSIEIDDLIKFIIIVIDTNQQGKLMPSNVQLHGICWMNVICNTCGVPLPLCCLLLMSSRRNCDSKGFAQCRWDYVDMRDLCSGIRIEKASFR